MSRGATPKGWPDTATYIAAAAPDPKLTKDQQRALLAAIAALTARPGCPQPQRVAAAPCPLVKITAIHDPKHPACGQHGLAAAKKLTAGQFVLPYVGYLSVEPHCSATSDYILRLAGNVALDAEVAGNEARFVNDFRGVAGRPNCAFNTFVDQWGRLQMGVFVGNRPVGKGEELLVSYGKGFWAARLGVGTDGIDGADGRDGTDGTDGTNGTDGGGGGGEDMGGRASS